MIRFPAGWHGKPPFREMHLGSEHRVFVCDQLPNGVDGPVAKLRGK